ncbi:alpha/beta hydrolase [Sphingopyxis sp. L1A2A]|uniref:alpha/beta fold hydrolase n=1 Tax=Sphingopyxis sp. L1A2A TaxID=2502247 RepID=UPI0010FA6007|nr:alpha/beta hydrolase [Sphingopyxis sp. L1A2A]
MTGAARPLICLGGTLCDARVFAPLLNCLSRSASIWSHSRFECIPKAAVGLLDALSEEFVAIGFSLGGFIALDALRLAPDKVAGVILISGNAFPDDPANARARRDDVAAGRREGLRALMKRRGAAFVSPSCAIPNDVVDMIAEMAEAEGHSVHARQAEMNIRRPDLRAVVAASERPILALAGVDDHICPSDRYRDLQRAPNATLTMIEGAGHFLPLEAPAACAEAIELFLKEHDL